MAHNFKYYFISSARFALSLSPCPVIVIVLLTSTYASLLSHKLDFNIEVYNLI